jgi:hypothetical protein
MENQSHVPPSTPDTVGGGAAPLRRPQEAALCVRRWRARQEAIRALNDQLNEARAAQREDEALLRAYLESSGRESLPLVQRGPDGQPVQIGRAVMHVPPRVPKPLTKRHLAEVIGDYDRVDEATRAHLLAYIWEQREFGPELVTIKFEAVDPPSDGTASASAAPGRKRARGGGSDPSAE